MPLLRLPLSLPAAEARSHDRARTSPGAVHTSPILQPVCVVLTAGAGEHGGCETALIFVTYLQLGSGGISPAWSAEMCEGLVSASQAGEAG